MYSTINLSSAQARGVIKNGIFKNLSSQALIDSSGLDTLPLGDLVSAQSPPKSQTTLDASLTLLTRCCSLALPTTSHGLADSEVLLWSRERACSGLRGS
jgi:hypothetical protein